MVLMMRELVGDLKILVVQLVFNVDHRWGQEFLDGLRHDGAHLGVGLKGLHVLFQEGVERRQVEVPISTGRISGVTPVSEDFGAIRSSGA